MTLSAITLSFGMGLKSGNNNKDTNRLEPIQEPAKVKNGLSFAITPSGALPDGKFRVNYYQSIHVSNGSGNYSFAITYGALPDGLSFDTGFDVSGYLQIGGSPSKLGKFDFKLYVHDNAYNASLFGEYSITINVNDSYCSDKPVIFLQSGDVAAGTLLGMSLDGYIYYTTDGTDPTASSNLYVDPIPITEDVTIKVVGYYYGYPLSEVTTLIYRVIRVVSYDVGTVDSGTSPIDDTEYFSGDIAIIKGIDGISNPGYEFKGWNTQADGNGTYYQPNNAYIITNKSLSLYAIWETQQVSFNYTDLADCTFLQDYYYVISATGGSGSYTYERISGFLPEGLTATQLEGSSELVIQGKPILYYPMYMPVFKVTDNYNHTTATANCVIRMNTAGKLTAPVANYTSGEVEKGSTFSLTANEGENILYSIDGG